MALLPWDEDYGYVSLEAMLSSKAVVTCSDSGGPLEFVEDRLNGLVCEPGPAAVAELAAELRTTTGALDRACLAARGKRAVELIHKLQLDRAIDLLRKSDLPTPRIAADLGYSGHAHFIRAFVAATGRTPDAFRAQSC